MRVLFTNNPFLIPRLFEHYAQHVIASHLFEATAGTGHAVDETGGAALSLSRARKIYAGGSGSTLSHDLPAISQATWTTENQCPISHNAGKPSDSRSVSKTEFIVFRVANLRNHFAPSRFEFQTAQFTACGPSSPVATKKKAAAEAVATRKPGRQGPQWGEGKTSLLT